MVNKDFFSLIYDSGKNKLKKNKNHHPFLPYPNLYGAAGATVGFKSLKKKDNLLIVYIDKTNFVEYIPIYGGENLQYGIGISFHGLLEDNTFCESFSELMVDTDRHADFKGQIIVEKNVNGKVNKQLTDIENASIHLHNTRFSPSWDDSFGLKVAEEIGDVNKIKSIKVNGNVENVRDVGEKTTREYKNCKIPINILYIFEKEGEKKKENGEGKKNVKKENDGKKKKKERKTSKTTLVSLLLVILTLFAYVFFRKKRGKRKNA